MPDPGLASPYRLKGNKYQALADIFTGIAGNKQDRLKNKLTEAQIRNATLLGDKRAVDLEEAKWAWGNVAKTPEALAKLLEGISGGGADAEAAFILGTTPEMVQKWKALQSGLNDIQRRTTIVNDEKRKADKAYRDGQIDQVQYDKIVAQTETELKRGEERGYASELRKKQLEKQILGQKAQDKLTGENVRQSQLEKQQTLESYSQATGPEPDIPPELQGLERGSDEWKRVFQRWILNTKPNQAQIDAVASGGTIAGSVSKKAQKEIDTSFWGRMKEGSKLSHKDLQKDLATYLKEIAVQNIEGIDPGEFEKSEQIEANAIIFKAAMDIYKNNPQLNPWDIYQTLISDPNNYLILRDNIGGDDVVPMSLKAVIDKYSKGIVDSGQQGQKPLASGVGKNLKTGEPVNYTAAELIAAAKKYYPNLPQEQGIAKVKQDLGIQ